MELNDALFLKEHFSGRWRYCVTDRFRLDSNKGIFSLKEVEENILYNSEIAVNSFG